MSETTPTIQETGNGVILEGPISFDTRDGRFDAYVGHEDVWKTLNDILDDSDIVRITVERLDDD